MKWIISWAFVALMSLEAFAHSPLEATSPNDGDILKTVPSEIEFTFRRDIRLTRITQSKDGSDSVRLDLGNQKSFATLFVVPMNDEGSGNYLIEWRGLGDDGHAQSGQLRFSVD